MLEQKVHQRLSDSGLLVIRQFTLELISPCDELPNATWDADFCLPEKMTLVEAKGEWINQKGFEGKKALFLMQVRLAKLKGFRVVTVGDKPFKIGQYQVKNYRETPWL